MASVKIRTFIIGKKKAPAKRVGLITPKGVDALPLSRWGFSIKGNQ